MNPEVEDFQEECDAIGELLDGLSEDDFESATPFKDWSINRILCHLTSGNLSAVMSLHDAEAFQAFFKARRARVAAGEAYAALEEEHVGHVKGKALLSRWKESVAGIVSTFGDIDLGQRVPWAKSMSARSSVSARLMENWSHAQAIYDKLGIDRPDTDRIKGIVYLGVNTFGWTFENQGLRTPGGRPAVSLTTPNGTTWHFEAKDGSQDSITGSAMEFCQVVTQVRNIADTQLKVTGATAMAWMQSAQCFAGPPHPPPAAGTRIKSMEKTR